MKKRFLFLTLFMFAAPAFSQTTFPPNADYYINDFAKVLSHSDSMELRDSLEKLQKQTGIQCVIVTIRSLADYNATLVPFQKYAENLFDYWGVGDKTSNNGILILFSLKDREARVVMGAGYGNKYDNEIQNVIDANMIPLFKSGEYSRGLYEGAYAVISVVTKKVSWLKINIQYIVLAVLFIVCIFAGISYMRSGNKGWGYAFFIAAGMILFFFLNAMLKGKGRRNRSGYGGGRSGRGGGGGRW